MAKLEPELDTTEGATSTPSIPTYRVCLLLWICTALLMLVGASREGLAFALGVPTTQFNLMVFKLDYEGTLPAWYSASLLLIAAGLIFLLAWRAWSSRSRLFGGWLLLGAGFIYLSADETASFHERIGTILKQSVQTSGALTFPWVIVGIPAVAVALLVLLPFLSRLPLSTRLLFLAAGAIFVGGAIGFEMISALALGAGGGDSLGYLTASTLEECLEMAGITLFVVALLLHVRNEFRAGGVQFS